MTEERDNKPRIGDLLVPEPASSTEAISILDVIQDEQGAPIGELVRRQIESNTVENYFVLGPPGAGKTSMVRAIASHIHTHHPGVVPIALSYDVARQEVLHEINPDDSTWDEETWSHIDVVLRRKKDEAIASWLTDTFRMRKRPLFVYELPYVGGFKRGRNTLMELAKLRPEDAGVYSHIIYMTPHPGLTRHVKHVRGGFANLRPTEDKAAWLRSQGVDVGQSRLEVGEKNRILDTIFGNSASADDTQAVIDEWFGHIKDWTEEKKLIQLELTPKELFDDSTLPHHDRWLYSVQRAYTRWLLESMGYPSSAYTIVLNQMYKGTIQYPVLGKVE